MPYVAIKMYPKDEKIRKELAEKISEAVVSVVGCPEKAVTVSIEEIPQAEWDERVKKPEIESKMDKMMILSGEKLYK